ncbi:hypothetical protein D3C87_86640 [compost metagenome]
MLQRLRRRWLLPIAALAAVFSLPSQLGGVKFVPIYEALTIRAQKNSPPHVAFEGLIEPALRISEWDRIEQKPAVTLATHQGFATTRSPASFLAKRIVVPEMVLKKNSEVLISEAEKYEPVRQREWVQSLSAAQVARLEEAQRRTEVLDHDWTPPTLAQMAQEVLASSGALNNATPQRNYYISGRTPQGEVRTDIPRPRMGLNNPPSSDSDMAPSEMGLVEGNNSLHKIVGPIEITGGLAVTNEHHIEVRRNDRGIYKELGRVDLQQGLYNIEVDDPSGTVVARLVNKDGKVLGEGSIRLGLAVASNGQNVIKGPKLKVAPHPDFAGIVTSAYNPKAEDTAPAKTRVTFVKGASEVTAKSDATVAMDNVVKKSTTVMRAAAPNHLQTTSIIVSGTEFKTLLYPENMVEALQNIISQQRRVSLEGAPRIIWGKVTLDGKALAGIDVRVESEEGLEPIYFNQFMIPDANLKATSENGLYAFIDVQEGFHSVLATRSSAIFGYQNVVVEEASVAQADIESTIRKESVPLNIYDAFTGKAVPATVTMQSLEEELKSETGSETLLLPPISRLGLMRVEPANSEYVGARYLYNDSEAFIHAPLIRWSWLSSIRTYLKFDDAPSTGTIVGFVPDEEFEVYLAGYDQFPARNIVYFDMHGRILQTGKGIAGGGFIIFNAEDDTHEVVVLGTRTQKMYSRVLPVDPASLSILTFRE